MKISEFFIRFFFFFFFFFFSFFVVEFSVYFNRRVSVMSKIINEVTYERRQS